MTFELDVNSEDDYYEESDTPSPPPALQPALQPALPPPPALQLLKDVTQAYGHKKQTDYPVEKLNNLSEPEIEQIQKDYGISLDNPTMRCNFGGRGIHYTSKRITRNRISRFLSPKRFPTAEELSQPDQEAPCHSPLPARVRTVSMAIIDNQMGWGIVTPRRSNSLVKSYLRFSLTAKW